MIVLMILAALGCATSGPQKTLGAAQASDKEYEIKLAAVVGRKEVSEHYSKSFIKSYSEDQISRERQESVEFDTESDTIKMDNEKGFIHTLVKTTRKEGSGELHDMAFPELNERLEMVFDKNAQVVFVSGFPESSVFYVPPISLPEQKVKIGDTWEMQKSWVSLKNSIPLTINMITILKNVFSCDKDDLCADLEVSGDVGIIATLNANANYQSELKGRILYSLKRGTVVWSLVKSEESMSVDSEKVSVKSCMISFLKEPKEEKPSFAKEADCDPKADIVVPFRAYPQTTSAESPTTNE